MEGRGSFRKGGNSGRYASRAAAGKLLRIARGSRANSDNSAKLDAPTPLSACDQPLQHPLNYTADRFPAYARFQPRPFVSIAGILLPTYAIPVIIFPLIRQMLTVFRELCWYIRIRLYKVNDEFFPNFIQQSSGRLTISRFLLLLLSFYRVQQA